MQRRSSEGDGRWPGEQLRGGTCCFSMPAILPIHSPSILRDRACPADCGSNQPPDIGRKKLWVVTTWTVLRTCSATMRGKHAGCGEGSFVITNGKTSSRLLALQKGQKAESSYSSGCDLDELDCVPIVIVEGLLMNSGTFSGGKPRERRALRPRSAAGQSSSTTALNDHEI